MPNDDKELISICIPTYNNGNYIEETIKSIIDQTYRNLQIIISDNNSDDDTQAIVLTYIGIDSRIEYHSNEENLGYTENIKRAISYAKGDVIAIYHSDDIYDKTLVEEEVTVLLRDQNIGAVFSEGYILNESSTRIKENGFYKILKEDSIYNKHLGIYVGDNKQLLPIFLQHGNFLTCPTLMIRKSTYAELGGYTDRYPSNEDFDFWLRILDAGKKIAMVAKPLFKYRVYNKSGTAIYNKKHILPMMYTVMSDYYKNNILLFKKYELENLYSCFMAKGYVIAAYRSMRSGLGYKDHIIKSINYNRYSFFTKFGFLQRILRIMSLLETTLRNK